MTFRSTITALLLAAVATATSAQETFTPLEQQKISIETPGLFSQSDAFTVDFSVYGTTGYCFPLPVGKAQMGKDNNVEIMTTEGDAIKAMFDGVVRMSWLHPRLGNVVVVRHDNGLETVYGRNRENRVKVGDKVKAGQTIAIVGGDGGRIFCEFAIMVNGGRINPNTILGLQSHRLLQQTVMFRKKGFNVEVSVEDPDPWQDKNLLGRDGKPLQTSDPFAGGQSFTLNLATIADGDWCYPLPGSKVISPYGRRGGRMHTGTDIKTKPNDNILAAFDGIVVMSQRYSAYGNCIILKHANGLETLYSHNSKNLVKVGERVKCGQTIALTGRTGRATTEHLHFEVRVKGRHYNSNILFDHVAKKLKKTKLTFYKNGTMKETK